jgi:hypothetical protein
MMPIISVKNNPDEPYLVLSNPILVTNHSDYRLIHQYVDAKLSKASEDFGLDEDEGYALVLKYKRIKLDINQIKKLFK